MTAARYYGQPFREFMALLEGPNPDDMPISSPRTTYVSHRGEEEKVRGPRKQDSRGKSALSGSRFVGSIKLPYFDAILSCCTSIHDACCSLILAHSNTN